MAWVLLEQTEDNGYTFSCARSPRPPIVNPSLHTWCSSSSPLVSTVAVETMIPEKEKTGSELMNELQDIRSKLDELAKGSS